MGRSAVFATLVVACVLMHTASAVSLDSMVSTSEFSCSKTFLDGTTLKSCTAKCGPYYEKDYKTYRACYDCCATHDREHPLCPQHKSLPCNGKAGFCNSETGKCRCFGGFSGRACQIRPIQCPESGGRICGGNGDCNADLTACICHPGYSGKACQHRASGAVLITSDFCDTYSGGGEPFKRLVNYALENSYLRPKGEKRVVATLPKVRGIYSLSDLDNQCGSRGAKNYIRSQAKRIETIWRLTDTALKNVDVFFMAQEYTAPVLSQSESMALSNFVRRGGSVLSFFGHKAGENPGFDEWARDAFGVQLIESSECRASGTVRPTTDAPKELAFPFSWGRNCHESMRILGGSKAKVIMKGTATSNSIHHNGYGKGDSVETVLIPGGALEDCPSVGKDEKTCNNRGFCQGDGSCKCIDNWSGRSCEIPPKCHYDAKGTCHGNGVCDGKACVCNPGWKGDKCDTKAGKNGAVAFTADYCNSYHAAQAPFVRVMNYVINSSRNPKKPVIAEIGPSRNGYSFLADHKHDKACWDDKSKNWLKERAASIKTLKEVTPAALASVDVLYIVQDAQSVAGYNGKVPAFSEAESKAIYEWVKAGGAIASFFGHEASKTKGFGSWAEKFGVSLSEAGVCKPHGLAEVNFKCPKNVARELQVPVGWLSNCHETVKVNSGSHAQVVLSHSNGNELAVIPPHSFA